MSIQAQVATLKQHLEQLFPGKWLSGKERQQTLLTGITEIDRNLNRGLARQRITEWTGPASSGKSTLLRAAIANWCASGFRVAYVDTEGKLMAADWALSEKFWVVRLEGLYKGEQTPKGKERAQNALWSADQLLRSNIFDVIVLDLGEINHLSSRIYARLQHSLGRSKAALLIVRDGAPSSSAWGCHTQLSFHWGNAVQCEAGLDGIANIIPAIQCHVWRDGLSQTTEATPDSHVSNRLFTHPQVPDRRTPKV